MTPKSLVKPLEMIVGLTVAGGGAYAATKGMILPELGIISGLYGVGYAGVTFFSKQSPAGKQGPPLVSRVAYF